MKNDPTYSKSKGEVRYQPLFKVSMFPPDLQPIMEKLLVELDRRLNKVNDRLNEIEEGHREAVTDTVDFSSYAGILTFNEGKLTNKS